MVKDPESFYERERSNSLLKVKKFYQAEAKIIDISKGTGKKMDSLHVATEKGIPFTLSSGFKG